jgi:2-amino-4-hydroxy-6-hydroxymethyldihydropteridine diphosphokinase
MNSGVFLLLGGNLGDRAHALALARGKTEIHIGKIVKASSVYKTAPWGITNQPEFYNQVIAINTNLNPYQLLESVLAIENEMGRIRHQKWGARIIDIDILFYQDMILQEDALTIPHPAIANRLFTLIPLQEIAPDHVHPLLQKKVHELILECPDNSIVEKLNV